MYRLISTRITSTFFFSLLNQVLAEKVVIYALANYNLSPFLFSLFFFKYVTNSNKLPDRVAKLNDDPISQLSFI